MKHLSFYILILALFLCIYGCKDEVTKTESTAKNTTFNVQLNNLPALSDSLCYKVWIAYSDDIYSKPMPLLISTFVQTTDNVQHSISYTDNMGLLSGAKYIIVSIDSTKNRDSVPKASSLLTKILAGTFQVNNSVLSTGHPMAMAINYTKLSGSFRLLTPGIPTNDTSGIWFTDYDENNASIASLALPSLSDTLGWKFRIMVTANSKTFSLGTFYDALQASSDTTYTGTSAPIPFPGQSLLTSAPAGLTFPISLANATVNVYMIPAKGAFKNIQPGYKLLSAQIPATISKKLRVVMDKTTESGMPAGTLSANVNSY